MSLLGKMLIGRDAVSGSSQPIHAVNPATGETLEPTYVGGGKAEVERACELAEAAFATYRETSLEERA
ncbi:aldehyde dehydrogenase (NADP(+)), partial [Billgrantia pellis]